MSARPGARSPGRAIAGGALTRVGSGRCGRTRMPRGAWRPCPQLEPSWGGREMPCPLPLPAPRTAAYEGSLCNLLAQFSVPWGPHSDLGCLSSLFSPSPLPWGALRGGSSPCLLAGSQPTLPTCPCPSPRPAPRGGAAVRLYGGPQGRRSLRAFLHLVCLLGSRNSSEMALPPL